MSVSLETVKKSGLPALRDMSAIEVKGQCGSGTFGMVYKGEDKETGALVALKKIKMEHEHQGFPITAIREIKILKALKHPNIVRLNEIMMCGSSCEGDERFKVGDVFMVFEYVDFDLAGLLDSELVRLSESHIRSYTKQLLDGILYMHTNGIIHRDLKSANILITRSNILKIGDWGLARAYSPHRTPNKMTSEVVTIWYRAPELCLRLREYSTAVDIWAAGCIFAEMFNRRAIMMGSTDIQQLELIYQLLGSPEGTTRDLLQTYPEWERMQISERYASKLHVKFGSKMDGDALSLLEKMLKVSPLERISAKDALKTSYFWGSESGIGIDPKLQVDPSKLAQFQIENGHEYERKQVRAAAEEREKEKSKVRAEKRKLELTVSGEQGVAKTKFKVIMPADKAKSGTAGLARPKSETSINGADSTK